MELQVNEKMTGVEMAESALFGDNPPVYPPKDDEVSDRPKGGISSLYERLAVLERQMEELDVFIDGDSFEKAMRRIVKSEEAIQALERKMALIYPPSRTMTYSNTSEITDVIENNKNLTKEEDKEEWRNRAIRAERRLKTRDDDLCQIHSNLQAAQRKNNILRTERDAARNELAHLKRVAESKGYEL